MYEAKIYVTLKKSVLDPQGQTILHAVNSLRLSETKDLRTGKYFTVTIDTSNRAKADEQVRQMCEKLLVNPIMEQYSYNLEEIKK
jgi:phosphoribosylformylglycinamidine synthase PurS subunit